MDLGSRRRRGDSPPEMLDSFRLTSSSAGDEAEVVSYARRIGSGFERAVECRRRFGEPSFAVQALRERSQRWRVFRVYLKCFVEAAQFAEHRRKVSADIRVPRLETKRFTKTKEGFLAPAEFPERDPKVVVCGRGGRIESRRFGE